ncbi:MAG: chromate efflux transporter [Methylobacteriaceae bacterium]|nr:chromate efflux transporter [Methylobacteriaceae bacterium]
MNRSHHRIDAKPAAGSALEVLRVFLKLGLTSFGGPIAHLGYFREEFVVRRKWIDEHAFADLVGLCQFLPGPASSQVAFSIGIMRAGLAGGFAAWLGFTAPSALAMTAFAYGVARIGNVGQIAWLHGLKTVAVAVVALAVWNMARNLCPDRPRATLAVGAALMALALPSAAGQVAAIVLGGLIGWRLFPSEASTARAPLKISIDRRLAAVALALFFGLLIGLPAAAVATGDHMLALIDSFYRSGSLVFGGGHVVLPLLQRAVVPPGWVGNDAFLAGYGAAQAVPGPLFTFAAYLGTIMQGWEVGLICLLAIYLPSFLLLIGVLPFWDALRRSAWAQSALRGVNASVVGLLVAALYQPVWTSAIAGPADFGLALVAFLLLAFWRVPPWLVVILGALGATVLSALA